jgi:Fe-S oxidoreductase
LRARLIAYLPHYAPHASRLAPLLNLRNQLPPLAWLAQPLTGISARRSLPRWQRPWDEPGEPAAPAGVVGDGRDLILLADTFNRYFEGENLEAAHRVLGAAGYRLHKVAPADGGRPLCCGRTFLSAGLVEEARREARRLLDAVAPFIAKGARIVGLEPACLFSLRDEFSALLPVAEVKPVADAALLIEECLAADLASGRVVLPLRDQGGRVAHLHGHCHQKSFGVMGAVESVLRAVPGLDVRPIDSSCCGMAGAFGFEADKINVSLAMAELSLFPALRKAGPDDLIVADGTSCRHQIADGLGLAAVHVARVLEQALAPSAPSPRSSPQTERGPG